MFHQFRVRPDHRNFLRFLWWKDSDLSKPVVEYRMCVHLFGATSSPAVATFGLRQIADDYGKDFSPEASEFLRNDFYVDDGLSSQENDDKALRIMRDTRAMCKRGGLKLHKFQSNSKIDLSAASLAPDERTDSSQQSTAKVKEKEIVLSGQQQVERALGVIWCVESDTLSYRINITPQAVTRRGILSSIASVFDPLGLISPVILGGKKILQQVTAEKKGWDEPLEDSTRIEWERWIRDIVNLDKVSIPRCYKPTAFGQSVNTQFHHFAD